MKNTVPDEGEAGRDPWIARAGVVALIVLLAVGRHEAAAQHSGHGSHPPMPGQQFYIGCRLENADPPVAIDAPLALWSLQQEADLTPSVALPGMEKPLRVLRYLPSAALDQRVVPDDSPRGRPAVEIAIEGPTQSYRRWLIADDPERNRLLSFIGTWRLLTADDRAQRDELLRQFENEFTRAPKLQISRWGGGPSHELDLTLDASQTLDDLKCTVRIRGFFSDYAMDDEAKKPVSRSDRRLNPAALVEIEYDGRTEQRWVFAKFPEFSRKDDNPWPFRVILDCPIESAGSTPDFAVLTIGQSLHEVWGRHDGRTTVKPLSLQEPIDISGSQYRFQVASFVPAGRIMENYRPADGAAGTPAIRIEVPDPTGSPTQLWLELGKPRVVPTAQGPMTVVFAAKQPAAPGGHP